ncbi:WD40 repeat protein [Nonlabens dokdonensis DSW-6]|uniref:WD40 repeat protein n=1 Tax=Nonlabens dokdonensis (strain DSM 17205 / KCTC 12402 / DSW-6) TaxID=592029 RepID=L7WDR6_NONDD|nr:WD40 repeat protein [Nonlabens dokdonensis DSW-6]
MSVSCSETSPEDLIDDTPITETVKYTTDVFPIVQSQCLSCHNDNFSSGNNSYSSYSQFRDATENGNVIDRITRSVGDPLLMPQGGQLPQNSINLILQWQTDGYLEN